MRGKPAKNHLLNHLPPGERGQMIADCDDVNLAQGEVLAEPGERIDYVYFPTTSSILRISETAGARLGVALIGNEGMFGASLVLGIGYSSAGAVVQGAGAALRMTESRFNALITEESALRRAGNGYLFVLLAQMERSAGCTRFHVLEARLARWLLMSADRAGSPSFLMTHELLARTLGVRRVGVTRAATSLQNRKLIRYFRGEIEILDRKGLIDAACPCYRADVSTYRSVLAQRA